MPKTNSPRIRRLQRRAEELLVEGQRDRQLVALLKTIATEAEDESEPALFAHRQLAELCLEDSPWQAALHLRRIVQANVQDDGVFALLGLCQSLLGNFRSAVSAYRRALQLAPNNPWYHHNLGHLLDVGLSNPRPALYHLRKAWRSQPGEDEVTASLAHCLARLGELEEAEALAMDAYKRAPNNAEHRGLVNWIRAGAKVTSASPPRRALVSSCPKVSTLRSEAMEAASDSRGANLVERVADLLRAKMPQAGFAEYEVDGGCYLWLDYASASQDLNCSKPAVLAAAVEYAFGKLIGMPKSQASVARRYGVALSSLSNRYRAISSTLDLEARG